MMSDWWAFAVLVHLIYTNKNVLVLADESNDIWTLLQTKANYVINPKMATAPKEIHDIVHNIISNHDNIKNRFVGSQIVNILSDLVGVQKADRIIEESWEWEQDY
jgi:hypothetical protein